MRALWCLLILPLVVPVGAAETLPLRLGLVVPAVSETGPAAHAIRRAADLAVADWTRTTDGRVQLVVVEDLFDPRDALTSATRLVQEGVRGVVGHYYSSSSIAAAPVYHAAGVPQVTATATHPRLTAQGFETVFRVCGRDDQQGETAAQFVSARLRARRVGIVHDRTEYGRGLVAAFRRAWNRQAAAPILVEESLAQGDRDFARQVMRLKAARLDVVVFGGVFREAGVLLREMRQAGLGATFVGGDAVVDAAFVALAGEEAAAGAYLTFTPDPRLRTGARPLVQRYEASHGPVGPHVLETYDAVGILLRAVETAAAAEPGATTPRGVARAIRAAPYQGALGTLRWDGNGDLTTPPYAVYVTRRGGRLFGWFDQVYAPGARPGM